MTHNKESGFTLVELAIVLMIIGVLIGGVLKGIELVENGRVLKTVKTVEQIQTAMTMFSSSYRAAPGDIRNPGAVIPNCTTAPCTDSGDGDAFINVTNNAKDTTAWDTTAEGRNFWIHLARTNMFSGIQYDYAGTPNKYGIDFPLTPLGGLQIQSFREAPRRYTYMMLLNDFNAPSAGGYSLTPSSAARIDQKMDDGNATLGKVTGYSSTTSGTCTDSGNNSLYLEGDNETKSCVLWFNVGSYY